HRPALAGASAGGPGTGGWRRGRGPGTFGTGGRLGPHDERGPVARPRSWARAESEGSALVVLIPLVAGPLDEDLPGRVVAVLLGPEQPPPGVVAELGVPGPDQPAARRAAVRQVDPGDLVVVLVLAEAA